METEEHHGQDNEFSNGQWADISGYNSSQHQSPMHEYNGFGFIAPTTLPLEPSYNRAIPPPFPTHQHLQPLLMPQWPSMMTSQSTFTPSMVPTAPASAPVSASTPSQPIHTTSTPRRTLTDADRRRMCMYHEENPTVKQTEIGAMFGVERRYFANWALMAPQNFNADAGYSTVSKVLRQKEKYLFPDDGSRSPVKRSKGKFPDIERALSNWARNHQRRGLPMNDNIIKEKARFFATTVGNSESHVKVNSTSWLEKFKQKNNLPGAKARKGSDANDSDGGFNADSNCTSGSHTPSGFSPISPSGLTSPPTMSPSRSQDGLKTDSPETYLDMAAGYRHAHSQSTTSLASVFSDNTGPSSFSAGPTSPMSPYFSPDPSFGSATFLPSQQAHGLPSLSSNSIRPRSQTFPMLGVEPSYISPPASSEPLTPKYLQQSLATPALESPMEEMPPPLGKNDDALHHSTSTPNFSNVINCSTSMPPPPTLTASPQSPAGSPSQDEARRALELVMTFFQQQPSGLVDPQEYITMGKLMEKLKLQQGGSLPGGLHQIPEHEMGRKRSIHSL